MTIITNKENNDSLLIFQSLLQQSHINDKRSGEERNQASLRFETRTDQLQISSM